jgi:hypothetical protein
MPKELTPEEVVQRVQQWPDDLNLQPLFRSALYGNISRRKQRLLAVALCRRIAHLFPEPQCKPLIEVAERYAEGKAKRKDFIEAQKTLRPIADRINVNIYALRREDAPRYALRALLCLTHPTTRHFADIVADSCAAAAGCFSPTEYSALHNAECKEQKKLVLDILPPIAVPAALVHWVAHASGTPKAVARALDEQKAYGRLPILADALEDASCDEEAIISHLRGPGPHVRGCWVVDMILGKT